MLRDRLGAKGHTVSVSIGTMQRPPSSAGAALFFERLLQRVPALYSPVTPAGEHVDNQTVKTEPNDITFLLDGSAAASGDLVVLFDGSAGERALFAALIDRRAPVLTVLAVETGTRPRAEALPALRDPDYLSSSLDDVLSRLVELLVASVDGGPRISSQPRSGRLRSLIPFSLLTARNKLHGRLLAKPEHWRIAICDEAGRPSATLPDDGARYYADPFSMTWRGTNFVFFEEYPFTTRRGRIAFSVERNGTFGPPKIALERPYHLSYPFLFEHAGERYMLPETCEASRVELYRASSFPDHWVFDAVLLDGVALADATLIFYRERFWLFAALADGKSSPWDRLAIFFSDDLKGPWRPHGRNPVVIDAGSARPAGRMWLDERTGELMRVAQDCREGYGRGVALLRVDELSPTRFRQSFVATLTRPCASTGGFHTFNAIGPGRNLVDFIS